MPFSYWHPPVYRKFNRQSLPRRVVSHELPAAGRNRLPAQRDARDHAVGFLEATRERIGQAFVKDHSVGCLRKRR